MCIHMDLLHDFIFSIMKLVSVMLVSMMTCTIGVHSYRDLCSIDEREYLREPIEILVQIKSYCTTSKIMKIMNDSSETHRRPIGLTAKDEDCTIESLSQFTNDDQVNQLAKCLQRNLKLKSDFNICNLTEAIGFAAKKMLNSEIARKVKCKETIDPYDSSPQVKQCIMKMVLGDLMEYLQYEPKNDDLCSKELLPKS